MLYLFTGLPRNGKSFYVLKRIIRELREHEKPIVTNFPVNLEKLSAYLSKRGLDGGRCVARFRFLDVAQVRRFWRFRGDKVLSPDPKTGELTFVEDGGCVFVIDEAHIPFHSHKWDEISAECPQYLSQHGKLKDDVFLVTQHIDKLAKQLKLDVQYYIEIAYKRRELFLIFQKGYHFLAKAWTGGVPEGIKTKPNQVWPFLPDKELFACYDSNAGHGVVSAGKGYGVDKFPGLPPWVFWLFLVGVAWGGVYLLFNAPGWILGKFFGKPVSSVSAEKTEAQKAVAGAVPAGATSPAGLFAVAASNLPSQPLFVTGIAVGRFAGELRYSVSLSDGRRLTHRDGMVKTIGPNFVDLESGVRLWVDYRETPPPVPPVAPDSEKGPGEAKRSEPDGAPSSLVMRGDKGNSGGSAPAVPSEVGSESSVSPPLRVATPPSGGYVPIPRR